MHVRKLCGHSGTPNLHMPRDYMNDLKWKRGDLIAVIMEEGQLKLAKVDKDKLFDNLDTDND